MNSITILPLGSREYHGTRLPLDTDTILAESFARRTAQLIGAAGVAVRVLEPERIGMSEEHKDFRGTEYVDSGVYVPRIRRRLDTIAKTYDDTFTLIVNGHGGNKGALGMIVPEFNYRHDTTKTFVADIYSHPMQAESERLIGEFDDHAGSTEASLLAAEGVIQSAPSHRDDRYLKKLDSHNFYFFRTRQFHELGVVKDTSEFVIDAEKGAQLRDFIVREVGDSALYWFHKLNEVMH